MTLLGFVTDLLQSGEVTLSPTLTPFSPQDLRDTAALLEKYHRWDALSMPLTVPDFEPRAAIWAAQYVCRALQFVMVRSLGEEHFVTYLQPFPGPVDAAAAYSADICLRHLPSIYDYARSLSPTDPLVTNMTLVAQTWAFSAVGMPVESDFRLENACLQLAYADRVLAARDRKRARAPLANVHIQAALGAHARQLWPDFEPNSIENRDNNAGTTDH
jgi:MoxR-vWA-beta-propeller ternary system domain bpX4